MKRRDFFIKGGAATLGLGMLSPFDMFAGDFGTPKRKVKNIIFLVSDGMSIGTLTMADLLAQRKYDRFSTWMNLYRENKISRALMDTASANSMVTDSAAASSSWGGGVRVNNDSLNVGPNGEEYKPILQKFKAAGKAVGCVTTVPATHATPAGFCINNKTRSQQALIAEKYLPLKFDVMMGGGEEYFLPEERDDGRDMFQEFRDSGYAVYRSKQEWQVDSGDQPVLGVYHKSGLPYTLDQQQDATLMSEVPTLAEMTSFAIDKMKDNPQGFVMQVEGGKVDWAAHGNDVGALLYDQLAFDEAVQVAMDFASDRDDTLVIITTDHGNANPGLIKGSEADRNFDRIIDFKQTNEWVLHRIDQQSTPGQIREVIEHAQGIAISEEEAKSLQAHYEKLSDKDLYNPYKLPFGKFAEIQRAYTNVGWAGKNHSGDFVELAMYGPGSELLTPFVKNTDLHHFMLHVAEVEG